LSFGHEGGETMLALQLTAIMLTPNSMASKATYLSDGEP